VVLRQLRRRWSHHRDECQRHLHQKRRLQRLAEL